MELRTEGVYVVTGGGGAVAAAVSDVFLAAGARLAFVDRRGEAARGRPEQNRVVTVTADLSSADEARRAVGEAVAAFGRVDGLIHTAGAFATAGIEESGTELFDRLLDDNLRSLHNSVRAALPELVKTGNGFVAGFSSSLVWEGGGGARMSVYAAAKAGVAYYLRSLEKEARGRGVRVAIVYPMSPIDTPANRQAVPSADHENWVDPRGIAEALLFAATRGSRGRLIELPIWAER
jgi:NAD(P)-dependent dehydrogenase (short-subunit alcohol dehydrogenase family)